MKILAIDTSGQTAGAAIVDEYITIGEINLGAASGTGWHHSERLMPAVERLFSLMGLTLADMDYVAYTAGPGSFTGLRIGAATALGLARGINRPAIAVPTLDALAYNIGCADALIMPMMDARRRQVYTAAYRWENASLIRITDYYALPIKEALLMANGRTIFLGDGTDAYREDIVTTLPNAQFAPVNANRQRAASVGCVAMQMLHNGYTPSDAVALMYVRQPQAVQDLERK